MRVKNNNNNNRRYNQSFHQCECPTVEAIECFKRYISFQFLRILDQISLFTSELLVRGGKQKVKSPRSRFLFEVIYFLEPFGFLCI